MGVGGIAMVGALFVSGLAAFVDGPFRESVGFQVVGEVCLGGGTVLLAIKNRGRNRPRPSEGGIAGEVGEVIKDVHRHAKGIVRVRSEL
jgi:hypothetical protein